MRTVEKATAGRIVVTAVGDAVHGRLAESRFVEHPFLAGGEHNLYEFAFAAAAAGHDVELRGWLDRPAFERLAAGAGVQPKVNLAPRRPEENDLVVVPEGWRNPLDYARLVLSPAQLVMFVLAAPGLFGWPFVAGRWEAPDPLTVPLDAVAAPEHFRGMAALGFRLVTPSSGIVNAAQGAGVTCGFVGTGRPGWKPVPEVEKSVDVAAVLDNRWAPLAQAVLDQLDGLTVDRIETVANEELVARLARAKALVWPSRIEGHAAITWEARGVGCVPVALSSNRFAVGLDARHGAVVVDEVAELAPALRTLLEDDARWSEMSSRGRDTAPQEVDWELYIERVREFLEQPTSASPTRAPLLGIGAALDAWLDHQAAEQGARLDELAVAAHDLTEATRNQERMIADLDHWRTVYERLSTEHAALQKERDALDDEKDRVTTELRGLLARRSVRAALRAAETIKRKDR
jgi:glycosyltransferase involved in cell wall biosynthesis